MHSSEEFKLDTKNMDEAASMCSELAEEMRNLRQKLDNAKTSAVNNWDGEGSKTFQKKYHVLTQQLKDITDELRDMAESIYTAQDAYIQTDIDLAKQLDGVYKPEGHDWS